jgi:hypothetical protein
LNLDLVSKSALVFEKPTAHADAFLVPANDI